MATKKETAMTNEIKGKFTRSRLISLLGMLGASLLAIVLFPTRAQTQVPPEVVAFIDLKCYGITGPDGLPLPPPESPQSIIPASGSASPARGRAGV